MRWQARVVDLWYAWMRFQELGYRGCVRVVARYPDGQSLDAPREEPRLERVEDHPEHDEGFPQPIDPLAVPDHDPSGDVAVPG